MLYIKINPKEKDSLFYGMKDNTLYYEGYGWTKPGSKAFSLEDTGNGYIFRDHFNNIKTSFDYAQLEALVLLCK